MQCILREKLIKQGLLLSEVSQIYKTDPVRFVSGYLQWLEITEQELSGLRSPMTLLLQSEKSALLSVMDGYRPGNVLDGKSVRKAQRAVTAQSLEKVSREIYGKIAEVDQQLDQLNEKLCHAVAVLASKEPSVYPQMVQGALSIVGLWSKLSQTPETIPMYNYFCAKLAFTDIQYLLTDIVQKIISNLEPV